MSNKFWKGIIIGLIIVLPFRLWVGSEAFGATYYMRADGTAANKAAATGCGAVGTAMSIATHNGETFAAGDTIKICDDGGVYRPAAWNSAALTPPSNGSSGNEITYEAANGDIPVFNGSLLATTWAQYLATEIYSDVQFWGALHVVWQDGIKLTNIVWDTDIATTAAAMSEGTWSYDNPNNLLYVWATGEGEPDAEGYVIEVNRWYACFDIKVNYISVANLILEKAYQHGMVFRSGGNNATVDNVTARKNGDNGILIGDEFASGYTNVTIQNSTAYLNGDAGIKVNGAFTVGADDVTIKNNTVYSNCWSERKDYKANIKTYSGSGTMDNLVIENNDVYWGCKDISGTRFTQDTNCDGTEGGGIWIDTVEPNGGTTSAIIRYNKSHNNDLHGIIIECCGDALAIGNLSYNNDDLGILLIASPGAGGCSTGGEDYTQDGAFIYNNTIYGNDKGIYAEGPNGGADEFVNNEIKNNISVGNTDTQFSAVLGAHNDGAVGSANVYNSNNFGVEGGGTNFIEWSYETYKATYDVFITASSQADNNVESDPLFTNAGADDFTLTSSSPCIDTGIIPTGFETTYLLNPSLTILNPWSPVVMMSDVNAREVGAYGYFEVAGSLGLGLDLDL